MLNMGQLSTVDGEWHLTMDVKNIRDVTDSLIPPETGWFDVGVQEYVIRLNKLVHA